MHSEPRRVRTQSARHRLLLVLGAASVGVVLAASGRAVRLATEDDTGRSPTQAVVVKVTPTKATRTTVPPTTAVPPTTVPPTTVPPKTTVPRTTAPPTTAPPKTTVP